jgi:hypothetical protein
MVDANSITCIPNFIQIRPADLEFNHVDGQTDRHSQPHMHSFRAHRAKNAQKQRTGRISNAKFVIITEMLKCIANI